MERDKLEQKLWDIRISRDKVEILEILAEFDRLKLRGDTLQAQLAKICLPIKIYGDVGHIRRTVIPLLCEQCKDISAQTLERVLDYLDSQKPDEAISKKGE